MNTSWYRTDRHTLTFLEPVRILRLDWYDNDSARVLVQRQDKTECWISLPVTMPSRYSTTAR
jgi:hypothetical protein